MSTATAEKKRVATPPTPDRERRSPASSNKKQRVTVSFDPKTWQQLEGLVDDMGTTQTAAIRRAVRVLSWVIEQHDQGYKVGLLKENEPPVLVELV